MKKRNVLAILVAGTLASLTFNLQAAEKSAAYKQGKKIYKSQCTACHQKKGQGIPGVFPPLAGSDYLLADKERAINVPLKGLTGKITVNGQDYNSSMPAFGHLTDDKLAAVMTYVMTAWGNEGEVVTADEVAKLR